LRQRKALGCEHIKVFGDVKKKHCSHALTGDLDLLDEVKQAEFFLVDGVIVTGARTTEPPSAAELRRVKKAAQVPVLIGSGMSPENIKDYFPLADGFIGYMGRCQYLLQQGDFADDETAHGIPEVVTRLKDAIAAADGLLIVTPEYNNSIPGVTKNAVDWLSRPPADIPRVFGGKPVALIGASPGRFGTILSQNAWLPVLRTLGAELWTGGRLMVSGAAKVFDADGQLVDAYTNDALRTYLQGFVDHLKGR
jgi:NAD(P)H-dependent FMN reductase